MKIDPACGISDFKNASNILKISLGSIVLKSSIIPKSEIEKLDAIKAIKVIIGAIDNIIEKAKLPGNMRISGLSIICFNFLR